MLEESRGEVKIVNLLEMFICLTHYKYRRNLPVAYESSLYQ